MNSEYLRAEAGGFVEYARLSTGQWIVSKWSIRMPRAHATLDTRYDWRERGGPAWTTLELDALQFAGGEVATVQRSGIEIYRTDAARLMLDDGTPAPRRDLGSIAGSVFDSLTSAPLRSARVHIADLGRTTRSDSIGEFRFDSIPPGTHVLWLDHPRLDSLGMYSLSLELDVAPSTEMTPTLSIASFTTLWHAACGTGIPVAAGDTGFVFGHVTRTTGLTSDGGAVEAWTYDPVAPKSPLMPGAMWEEVVGPERAKRPPPVAKSPISRASLGDDGSYAICGVPARRTISLHAVQGDMTSPAITMHVGDARIARRDLIVASEMDYALAARGDSTNAPVSSATDPGSAVVAGAVLDTDGKPVANARVRAEGLRDSVLTDRTGAYRLSGLPDGSRWISIVAIGYMPAHLAVDFHSSDSVTADARLTRFSALAAVRITERQKLGRIVGDITQRRRAGFGFFSDSTRLANLPGLWVAFSLPGVIMHLKSPSDWRIAFPRPNLRPDGAQAECTPNVFIDGAQSAMDDLPYLSKASVALVETYPHRSGQPMDGVHSDCGSIFVWTKGFLSLRP
jgi:hypothetical protein